MFNPTVKINWLKHVQMFGVSAIDFKRRLHLFEDLFDQNTVKTTIKKKIVFSFIM